MTCVELRESLAENESGKSAAQRAHLKACLECSSLVADLDNLIATAVELRGAEEPSPRVWNSIEIALRQEGLIRPQHAGRSLLPAFGQWGFARWLLPAAAALLIAIGIYVRPHSASVSNNVARVPVAKPASDMEIAGLNDDDLIQEVAAFAPAMQAAYSDNLRSVNESIQDAKDSVAADPNDEEARRSLMDAYQQKAMLFDLAMDRSLP
ncbi:MAG TPA: hypothetical protein VHW45_01485 [Candidatus Sulfotelmatobacter sp.]|nr:hypothetical protein [Candidatus Sulfotelmatobacter sp.]